VNEFTSSNTGPDVGEYGSRRPLGLKRAGLWDGGRCEGRKCREIREDVKWSTGPAPSSAPPSSSCPRFRAHRLCKQREHGAMQRVLRRSGYVGDERRDRPGALPGRSLRARHAWPTRQTPGVALRAPVRRWRRCFRERMARTGRRAGSTGPRHLPRAEPLVCSQRRTADVDRPRRRAEGTGPVPAPGWESRTLLSRVPAGQSVAAHTYWRPVMGCLRGRCRAGCVRVRC
jgi:hypothetical protein